MDAQHIALPVRPGEHACCRFARRSDRERLTVAFVRAGLARGQRVIYLHDGEPEAFVARLAGVDDRARAAFATGQLQVRPATEAYLPHGSFDPCRMIAAVHEEQRRAHASGFAGLAITGEVSTVYDTPHGHALGVYEAGLDRVDTEPAHLVLCQYPPGELAPEQISSLAAMHDVDASPELAPIGRGSALFVARVRATQALRFAGHLDFDGAPAVADVLAAHYHGTLRLDLSDVTYADVAGMRALRGRAGQRVLIDGASDPVRRLAALLAWDADPDVELPEAPDGAARDGARGPASASPEAPPPGRTAGASAPGPRPAGPPRRRRR